jgi:pimeloyl-[acyl-carrier protein] methyl ester esterase
MKTTWLRKEGAEELLLFFNGWGMDRCIADYLLGESLSEGFFADLLLFHDYRTLEPEQDVMREASRYSRITIVAWSFGVWVAQHTELPPIDRAIAINGTLYPVNEKRGISPQIFQATLATWSEKNRSRFNRRMCGTDEVLALFSGMSPDRTAVDQQEELARLQEHVLTQPGSTGSTAWRYDHAIIGGRDLVFPAEQQYQAWKGFSQTVIADMPHFPFFHFRNLQEVLACLR